jgi:iron complex outermembrane receptor protein
MPVNGLKRIEVIKGPGSAIYGADAFGGVVNLVSDNEQDATSKLNLRSGRFNSQQVGGQHVFNQAEHRFHLAFNYLNYDDDPNRIVTSDLQSTLDDIFGSNASKAPGSIDEHYEVFSLNALWQWQNWSLNYWGWRNIDGGLASGVSQSINTGSHFSSFTDHLKLEWDLSQQLAVDDMQLVMTFKRQNSKPFLHVFAPGTILPIGSDGNVNFVNPVGQTLFTDGYIGAPFSFGKTFNLNLTQLLDISNHKVRWQMGFERRRITTKELKNFGPGVLDGTELVVDGALSDVTGTEYIFMPALSREFYFLSLLDEWQINDSFIVNLGARYDHYSDFGATINPRVSGLWKINHSYTLKMFTGSAFRAPSFMELHITNNPVAIGNTQLQPEGVDTVETGLAIEYLLGDNLFMSTSLFRYHADDLIDFVFDPVTNSNIAQNVGEQIGKGGEFTLRYKPQQNITVNVNYSRMIGQSNDQQPLADYPAKMLYASVNWQVNQYWQWALDSKWIADRARKVGDDRPNIKDYQCVTTRVSHTNLIEGLTVALAVKNLFDEDALEPSNGLIPDDLPLHGRLWSVEFNYVF